MRCLLRERRAVVFVANCAPVTEEAVRESGLGWTFLRPNSFMSNTFRWIAQARSGGCGSFAFRERAHCRDRSGRSGAGRPWPLSARATTRGRADRLSGAEALLPGEQVRIVAEVPGRELRLEAQSDEDARAEMSTRMPAEYVEAFSGSSSTVSSTNHRFCPRSRRSQGVCLGPSRNGHVQMPRLI
jgi:uncharacterized protein YbjT (DUF2867 family)